MDKGMDSFLESMSYEQLEFIDYDVHILCLKKFLDMYKKDSYTMFDIGSNGGSFIKAVRSLFTNSKLYAFEPHPILFKHITDTFPEVIANNSCCGSFNGSVDINIPSTSVAISSILNRPLFKELKDQIIFKHVSKCTRIDSYCAENNIEFIDYIKIDVEGYEYNVLQGLEEMLKQNKVSCGHFEVTINELYPMQFAYDMLEKYGYKIDKTVSIRDCFFYL
jgi:FkbM family methyltransferase